MWDIATSALTSGPTLTYQYNAAKRLSAVLNNGTGAATYGYDHDGLRVWRTVAGSPNVQTHYIYDPNGHLLAEHDGASGTVRREYVWLDELPIALIVTTGGSEAIYAIHTGQLSEPLAMTDAAKAKVWDGYLDPWGKATTFTAPTVPLDLRLPGQYEEAETGGLYQNWHRSYDPALGRYVQSDPLGIEAGQNIYAYVDGDPLNVVDVEGLQRALPRPLGIPIPIPGTIGPDRNGNGISDWTEDAARKLGRDLDGIGDWLCRHSAICQYFKPPIDPPAPPPAIPGSRACEPDDDCDLEWEEDRATCKRAWRFVAQDGLAVCFETAFARYSECRTKGGPITPLYLPRRTRKGWEY